MKTPARWHQLSSAKKDAIRAIFAVALIFLIIIRVDLAEMLEKHFVNFEYLQLDEFPYLLLLTAIALLWYSKNRTLELRDEIVKRLMAEKNNEQLLKENKQLTQHVLHVQELERVSLARDLHDDIGQYLLAIRLDASTLTINMIKENNLSSELALKRILSNAAHIQHITKILMRRLRPAPTTNKSFLDAIDTMIQEWREQEHNIHFSLQISTSTRQIIEHQSLFPADVSISVYRIIQEALSNSIKHANAKNVSICLAFEVTPANPTKHHFIVRIKDDGKGINQSLPSQGFGVVGMRERTSAIGGEFHIGPNAPTGVIVSATIPANLLFSSKVN